MLFLDDIQHIAASPSPHRQSLAKKQCLEKDPTLPTPSQEQVKYVALSFLLLSICMFAEKDLKTNVAINCVIIRVQIKNPEGKCS